MYVGVSFLLFRIDFVMSFFLSVIRLLFLPFVISLVLLCPYLFLSFVRYVFMYVVVYLLCVSLVISLVIYVFRLFVRSFCSYGLFSSFVM